METSLPQVFAGGDVASFPFYLSCRDRAVVCHWQMACFHGKVAALNILGREISIEDVVPSFWTHVCGINVRYLGMSHIALGLLRMLITTLFYGYIFTLNFVFRLWGRIRRNNYLWERRRIMLLQCLSSS